MSANISGGGGVVSVSNQPTGMATEATIAGLRSDTGTSGNTPPATLGSGTGMLGWLRSIYEKLTGTLAVTGTFFQATQPVSAASLPLPTGAATETTLGGVRTDIGTDGTTPPAVLGAGTGVRGWLRSIYEKLTGSIAVTGTFFQATQPVSIAVNTPDVTDRAARALGTIANTTFGSTLAAETTKVIGTVNIAAGQTISAVSNGIVSAGNSSAVALAANGAFTGTGEDVTEYADLRVSVFTDQASAVDGLQIQQSSNGTNWDILDNYSIPASVGKNFSVGVSAKFYRVVYTNGATANTVFRLQSKLHKTYSKGSSVRPQDGRTNDNDVEEVMSLLSGFNGTSWDRLRSTVANGLAVDVTRLPALVAGTAVVGALVANQSVNATQINGVALSVGSGVSGTGVPRVVLATDVVLPAISEIRAATLHVTVTAAVNTAATASLPAPAAGLFHYITSIQVVKLYNVLGVAAGAGVLVTSTNLPGAPVWTTEQAAGAVGTAVRVIDYQPTTPLKAAVAATISTVAAPAQLQTIWRINVSYFTAA